MSNVEAFPICWPPGRPRTPTGRRVRARFHARKRAEGGWVNREGITLAAARDTLFHELQLLRATRVILSTNLRLRLDGLPMSGQRQPDDPGAAVYFHKGGTNDNRQLCFACDRWDRVEDNIVAIAKTIEALRGIDRWGTGDMVRAAFTGFQALPAPPVVAATRAWWEVLGCQAHTPSESVEANYRMLARENHPDRGGDTKRMEEINTAYGRFKRERGLT